MDKRTELKNLAKKLSVLKQHEKRLALSKKYVILHRDIVNSEGEVILCKYVLTI